MEKVIAGDEPAGAEYDLTSLLQEIRAMASNVRVVESLSADLAAVARAGASPSLAKRGRRLVVLTATIGLLVALAGVAMAADGSYPGQPLYAVDVAFERIGIGAGGTGERLAEVHALLDEGRHEEAEEHLADSVHGANAGDGSAATLESPAVVSETVDAKATFIDDNKGDGIGVDGVDFGRGTAGLAPENQGVTPSRQESQSGLVAPTGPNAAERASGAPGVRDQRTAPDQSGDVGPPEKARPRTNSAPDDQ